MFAFVVFDILFGIGYGVIYALAKSNSKIRHSLRMWDRKRVGIAKRIVY